MKMRLPRAFVRFLPLLIGGGFLLAALVFGFRAWQQTSSWAKTPGEVVYNHDRGSERNPSYHAEVEFKTESGQSVIFIDNIGSSAPEFQQGAQVDVVYNPTYPQEVTIRSWRRIWLSATIFGALGSAVLVIGILFARR